MTWRLSWFQQIVLGTILITRISLGVLWTTDFMAEMQADSWHHAYTGLILIFLSLFLRKSRRLFQFVLGVGLGLVIDEITFPACLLGYPIDYWSWGALCATVFTYVSLLYLDNHVRESRKWF